MGIFKNITKSLKKAAPVIGGTIGFMIAGPTGAAIGSGIGSLAAGKSSEEALMAAALGYGVGSLGASAGYGPTATKAVSSAAAPVPRAAYGPETLLPQTSQVTPSFIDKAKEYWNNFKENFKKGNPPIELGVAPVYQWECNIKYCNFYEVCGGGLKGKGDEL